MDSDWTGTYTWQVKNWTRLTEKKIYSPEFDVGGYSWRLMLLPRGNEAKGSDDHISVYLNFPEASFTPPQMCPKAKFELLIMKVSSSDDPEKREATHRFSAKAPDLGFAHFIPIQQVLNPRYGFLVDDTVTICVNISIQKTEKIEAKSSPPPSITADAPVEVPAKKQGEGGYIYCLLQSLFHIGSFRKAIYEMPAPALEASEESVVGAVQSIFYQFQQQNAFPDISKLKAAMGWESNDTIAQHDLQKMHSTLIEMLDQHSIDQDAQSVTSTLFRGRMFQCIECLGVQYASTCKQAYTEIQLDVLGCKDVYESLKKYCNFERLGGTDEQDASFRGLINTRQGVLFESFPPVLQLHLKRSFYDSDRNVMLKVNSHHEFFDELDLDFNRRGCLSKNADKAVENKYKLHSVIAHRTGPDGGRYFAFIRPNDKWYKFGDEDAQEVSGEDAIDKQFGTEDGAIIETLSQEEGEATYSTASTLVYVRASEWERLMCDIKREIPRVLSQRFDSLNVEEESRDEREPHHYVLIKLATEKHFQEQLGKSYYFDLVKFNTIKDYRLHKKTPFEGFKEMVREDFGIPDYLQRFWLWDKRPNNTNRVSKPLNEGGFDLKTVLDLRHFRDKTASAEQEKVALMTIKLFLESPDKASVHRDTLRPLFGSELLIFLKYYDPKSQKLSYLGHMFAEKTDPFHRIFEKAKKMAQLAPEEEIIVFEEIKHLPSIVCSELDPDTTPQGSGLLQGDIMIIQKAGTGRLYEFPTVQKFLEFVQSRVTVNFKPLKHPEDEGFKMDLLKTMTYQSVTNLLAKQLQVDDPKKLRLTLHNFTTRMPQKKPIKYNGTEALKKTVFQEGRLTGIIYVEILDKQLPYVESLRSFTIGFHNAKGERESEHELTLPKDDRVSDLVRAMKVEMGKEYSTSDMRIMEVRSSKVFKMLANETGLEQLFDGYSIFRAEFIPQDQEQLRPDESLVLFCHGKQEDNGLTVFGDPIWVKVRQGETIREVKIGVKKILEISDEEFRKWRFAYHERPMHPVEYLIDEDDILSRFARFALRGRTNRKYVGDNTSFIAMVHEPK